MNWNLQHALQEIRLMQPKVRELGFHITLGGSVLNKGFSENDLDLYFLPLEEDEDIPEVVNKYYLLEQYLIERWGTASVNTGYDSSESAYRQKLIFGLTLGKKIPRKIDVFIV